MTAEDTESIQGKKSRKKMFQETSCSCALAMILRKQKQLNIHLQLAFH